MTLDASVGSMQPIGLDAPTRKPMTGCAWKVRRNTSSPKISCAHEVVLPSEHSLFACYFRLRSISPSQPRHPFNL